MKSYQQEIRRIIEKQTHEPCFESDSSVRSFTFFSANLGYFGVPVSNKTYLNLYKKTRLNQALAVFDQDSAEALAAVDAADWEKLRNWLTKPGIIATFHIGSYRLLNQWLMREGIPFVLLIAQKVYNQQCALFQEIYCRIQPKGKADFQLLIAEDPYTIKRMKTFLAKGYHVLIYADGATGSQPKPCSTKMTAVPLFNKQLYAHHGLAYLSFLANVPVYPILVPRTDAGLPYLWMGERIAPTNGMDRHAYITKVMRKLFELLQACLNSAAWQWENWLSIQEYVMPENDGMQSPDLLALPDVAHFLPYRSLKQCYLLNTTNLNHYLVSEAIYTEFVKNLKSYYL